MSQNETATPRLESASFEVIGRFADASNATLLVRLTDRDPRSRADPADGTGREPQLAELDPSDLAVHKPRRGEAPLWDFPAGTLHLREIAAYEISHALVWDLVAATVLRIDGPFGPGSLQRFVPNDPRHHYFTLLDRGGEELGRQLRAMVLFDLVIDNADRKGGHVLLEEPPGRTSATTPETAVAAPAGVPGLGTDRIQLVDHGVSFNVERKLRTVAWDFAGEEIPDELRADVVALGEALDGVLVTRLEPLLSGGELDVLRDRVRDVALLDCFPAPSGHRPFPWPML